MSVPVKQYSNYKLKFEKNRFITKTSHAFDGIKQYIQKKNYKRVLKTIFNYSRQKQKTADIIKNPESSLAVKVRQSVQHTTTLIVFDFLSIFLFFFSNYSCQIRI